MVYRILRSMFAVGIFDRTYPTPASALNTDVSTPADNQVALTAVRAGDGAAEERPGRRCPLSPRREVDRRHRRRRGRRRHVRRRRVGGGQPDQPRHPASPASPAARPQAGDTVSYSQGNANYRSLSALPDADFTPTAGTGPGWTATYYAGSAASGTPLGSEVVTSLNVTGTPAIVTAAGATTWSVAYTADA